jgi:hypothetical protein
MADKAKKTTKKKEFDLEALKLKYSSNDKYKDQEWLNIGEAFQNASGVQIPIGGITQVLGWSNTGKTTILSLAAIAAQRRGILPVFLFTEQKFSFQHAKDMGLDCELKTAEDASEYWDGFMLYKLGFEYIEQIFDYIKELLDEQAKGNIDCDLMFLWDSVGTVPCKMSYDGKGGTMHTARVIKERWGESIAQKIQASNKASYKYRNSAVIINQPWFRLPDNPVMGQGRMEPKGGQAIYLSANLVIRCGNAAHAGTSQINLVHKGRKVNFGVRTKVTVVKNHIHGLGFADSSIIAVPHGFIPDDPEAIKAYKAEHSQYWADIMNIDPDEELEFVEEDIVSEIDTEDMD